MSVVEDIARGGVRREVEAWSQTARFHDGEGMEHRIVLACGHVVEVFVSAEEYVTMSVPLRLPTRGAFPCPSCTEAEREAILDERPESD